MDLKTERSNTIAHAQKIIDRAKTENRDLTTAEQSSVEADFDRIHELDKQIKGRTLADSVMKLGTSEWPNPEHETGLFSEEAKAGLLTAVKTRTAYRTEIDRKALTSNTLLPPSGTGVQPGLHPNIYPVADLFRNEAADGPVQRYYRVTAGTAEVVAEGAQKPDSGTTFAAIDVPLKKIAALSKVSDELSQDAAFLLAYLADDLRSAVISKENEEIVAAFTASGILTDSGAADTVLDLVGSAIAAQESISGTTPTAVIAHPLQVAAIRAMKASTAGTYHVDPWTAGPPSLHGLRLVSTPAVAAGTVWVVSSQALVVYRRGPVTVETGLDGTDFSFNLRTVIAEERMAPAVVRANGITEITLT